MKGTVNKVILVGRLGKDPEIRGVNEKHTVGNFTLATNNYDGSTEWHNIEAWNKTAEVVEKYTKKGSRVYVEGRLKTDKYEKGGQTKYSTKVVAISIQLLDDKNSGKTAVPAPKPEALSTHQPAPMAEAFDDDVPF